MKRISFKNLPSKSPIPLLVASFAFLKAYNASDLCYGVTITMSVLLFISWIHAVVTADSVDIFENKDK